MAKTIIAEGKTTNEAIENGLKELNVSKNMVDIKVLENEDKRSFFSILAPRVVKVELTVKEKEENIEKKSSVVKAKKEIVLNDDVLDNAEKNIRCFMEELLKNLPENTTFDIKKEKSGLVVSLNNKDLGYLIGYRGETLYSLQNIMTSIAGKGSDTCVRVILDIEGYKEKREKTLQDLAHKVAKTVMRTKKSVKLEPMQAYERKIIHSALQDNNKIDTTSVGEEPYRRIVVSLK